MKEYKTVQNYLIFQEMFADTTGNNFRVGFLENKKPVAHRLMCQVNPLISTSPERLRRVKILLEGIKKAAIPALYSPMEMVSEENQLYLIYDYFKGRNLEKIFDDASQKGISFSFDLAFSIAIAIADIIESGSTIIISGEKSFHGFLTPDNILFHFDGKIFLKNYGIFPYLDKTGSLFSDMETRYGNWLTPEFVRKEKSVSQSDIYHLGYIMYKMLTGKYFSLNPGEDFDSKLATVSLKQYIPSTDKDFHANLINFFKKTLHPDPMKRFLSIKDFKDYIANYFHIEELSSITFNVAYFMNSLYSEVMEREEKLLHEELAFVPAAPKREAAITASIPEPRREPVMEREKKIEGKPPEKKEELISDILDTLDKQKKRRGWPWVAALAIIGVVAGSGYFVINQQKKAKESAAEKVRVEQELQEKLKKEIQKSKQDQAKREKQREDERNAQQAEIDKLLAEKKITDAQARQFKLDLDRRIKDDEDKKRLEDEKKRLDEEAEKKNLADEIEKKRLADEAEKLRLAELAKIEAEKVTPGQEITPDKVDVKPELQRDLKPGDYVSQSAIWKKRMEKYKGRSIPTVIRVHVDETGKVIGINFLDVNPPDDVKELMREVAAKWIYKPAEKNGVKVKTWTAPKKIIIQN